MIGGCHVNQIITGNRHDREYKRQLNQLMQLVFGFTLDRWDALGLWDDRYRCYSLQQGDRLVANVSVAEMELLLGGERVSAIQLGAVATLPECRGKGLARQLLSHVLELHANRPAFLMANQSVVDFYPRFGFQPLPEIQPVWPLAEPLRGCPDCRLALDSPQLSRLVQQRQHYSQRVDVVAAEWVNWFHLVMEFSQQIYYLPDLDTVVIAKQQWDRLVIYDLLCSSPPTRGQLLRHLPFPGVNLIEFAFTPDWLGGYTDQPYARQGDWGYLFGRNLPWDGASKFPYLALT